MVSEEYRVIDGFPLYEVSNLGNILSWNFLKSKENEIPNEYNV